MVNKYYYYYYIGDTSETNSLVNLMYKTGLDKYVINKGILQFRSLLNSIKYVLSMLGNLN